jgi:thioredoxin-like negative regulator of GroEL
MDNHLRIIAPLHPETRFISINAERAPFFVTKLGIRVMPSLLLFKDGVCYDRIIGFDKVSVQDVFPTHLLAKRLVALGVMKARHSEEEAFEEEDSDDD